MLLLLLVLLKVVRTHTEDASILITNIGLYFLPSTSFLPSSQVVYAYGDVSILGVLPSSLDNGVLPGGRKEAAGVAPIDVFGGPLLGVVFPPSVDEDVRWTCY